MEAEVKNYFQSYGDWNTATTRKYLIILLVILFTQFGLIKNERIMKITNIQCKSVDTKFVNITECKMRAVQRDTAEISVNCVLLQKPLNNATLRGVLRKRGIETGKPIIDFEVDCCAFIRNKRRNVWASLAYTAMGLAKWSNFNHTCPYDHDLLVDKYRFNGKEIVKYLPFSPSHYTLRTYWHSLNVLRGLITINFQIFDN